MSDSISKLIFACAALSFVIGMMLLTMVAQAQPTPNYDNLKCEVAQAWIDSMLEDQDFARYYRVTDDPKFERFFEFHTDRNISGLDNRFSLSGLEMPKKGCDLNQGHVFDLESPSTYAALHDMQRNEELLELGVHYVQQTRDGRSAILYVTRYTVPSERPTAAGMTGAFAEIRATKSAKGWQFHDW